MIKCALHTVSYSGTWKGQRCLSLEKIIFKVAKFGYGGIEIMAKRPHASPLDLDTNSRKKLKEFVKSKGLEIACVAAYNDFADPNPYNREINLLQIRETIRLAHDIGAKLVRVFASGMGDMHTGASFYEQWTWVRENLMETAKYAEDCGVTLGLQNHSPLMHSYKNVLQMIKEVGSDSVKAIIDAPLLFKTGELLTEAVREVGNLMVHSHTGDLLSQPRSLEHTTGGFRKTYSANAVPMGEGNVDYKTFIKSLREINYEGFLSYEICSPILGGGTEKNLDRCVKKALEYTRSLLRQ